MRAYDVIYKKREGQKLSADEIEFMIAGYTGGEIYDYQMSAWAMAIFLQGMDEEETTALTVAMAKSGYQADLSDIKGFKADKHSSGGVGDTTSMVLVPLVSSTGLPVAKMAGRGLGHGGGTIDKLESIPGFNVSMPKDDFIDQVNDIGEAIISQTNDLAPADKKLYALRDVTATVDCIPLIASSIMSKKLAGGADGIVLDVKVGSGAFMKKLEDGKELARTMVKIGNNAGRKTIAVITDMDQPLGFAVGNALEVQEAIDTLKGEGPADLTELCLSLGANMLKVAGRVDDYEEGYQLLEDKLASGEALEKFKQLLTAQGGDPAIVEDESLLPQAEHQVEVRAEKAGYIHAIDALEVGLTAMDLGAGRKTKDGEIDPAAGIVFSKKIGDEVNEGDLLATLHFNEHDCDNDPAERVKASFTIEGEVASKNKLIYEIIE
ncbi:MAG: pyrimidine-nucleoside phosphorylase [Halanaerobium sp.]|nr:pyrimidine-nucleoside phosphorylase [Halanaerobium sp.]